MDDVALLTVMLEVLDLALTAVQQEVAIFGLQSNLSHTKILQCSNSSACSKTRVADGGFESDRLICLLGKHMIDSPDESGGIKEEVLRRPGIAWICTICSKINVIKVLSTFEKRQMQSSTTEIQV